MTGLIAYRDIFPAYSKSRVNNAGKAVRQGKASEQDFLVIENWRASHTHVLNTFQANLRGRTKNENIIVAQRLKRRTTIFDKLAREDGMALARMHDIAGCRLIFENVKQLNLFRKKFHDARFDHRRKNAENDGYNYILTPKASGYRGIHDVYEYVGSKGGKKWDGLLIEIQYRTKFQHAWATAVEIAGSITENQPKFNKGDQRHKDFFRMASEMIARVFENEKSCLPDITNKQLAKNFLSLEKEIHLLRTLEGLNSVNTHISQGRNVILKFSEKDQSLQAFTFNDPVLAVEHYFALEQSSTEFDDIVLVRADTNESIRNAFRNYFSDAKDFVAFIKQSIGVLKSS